jgi:cellulose synthase/poly-beta-1,6-N-acetylglucosamine synthase-like glycosyltransferase
MAVETASRPGDQHSSLPVDIAFLARHGISPAALEVIAQAAARLGVPASRQAIASGLIGETAFYRALAAECGLPFHAGPLRILPGGDHSAILRAGQAALVAGAVRPFRFVLAPEDAALRRMLETGLRGRPDICVVTPSAFAADLRRANAVKLAHRIAGRDEAGRTRIGAWDGFSRGQMMTMGASVVATAVGGLVAPFETFFLIALLLGPVFLVLIWLRLAAVFERPPGERGLHPGWRIDDARLPVYTVAVPLRREEAVLPQLVAALSALDYPSAKLEILILVEADDTVTPAALAQHELPPRFRVLTVPPGKPHTKPRALNLALLEARGSFFTMYDAEDLPDPQQLRLAAARFLGTAPELACLQARLTIDYAGEGWLAGFFALEYAGLFHVLNPSLLHEGLPILLGGTSNHFRIEALRTVGGWDAWNVTEDADLGLRLLRAGYRMADLPSRTREEAPLRLRAWLKQRARWIKGYIQTLVTHLREPRALLRQAGPVAGLTCILLVFGTVVTALFYPLFALALLVALWTETFWLLLDRVGPFWAGVSIAVSLFGLFAILLAPALGAVRRGAPGLLRYVPLLPLYHGLVSVAAWLALYEFFARRYSWNKTMHGAARRDAVTAASAIPAPPRLAAARC